MELSEKNMELSEILMHHGERMQRESYFHAVSPPIVQSSNFTYATVGEMREVLADEQNRALYTRGSNPTVQLLQQKIAALEHTEAALAFGSGSAAVAAAIIGNVEAGAHIICVQKPYSWTFKLINQLLARFGVTATFVDGRDVNNIIAAKQENTRLLVLESPNSLTFELQDIAACAAWAKSEKITTVIDNSHASPLYQNPADAGIDIIVHSGTKYLNGHSDVVWGALACSNAMATKLFNSELMTLGAILSPHDAWLILRGLRTFELRLARATATATRLVEYLEAQPWVDYVLYPHAASFPQYELAKRQMRGAGGLFSLNLKCDSMEKVERFCNAMSERFLMAVSWGGYESLQLPTCVFYNGNSNYNPPLPFTFVRYYAGLEDADYLIAAFEAAKQFLF
jgi:cystathionine beta-lyase/cystathionine gamma-synthase